MCFAGGRVKNHKLGAYRTAMVQILQAQLKDHRTEPDTDLLSVLGLADNPAFKACAFLQHRLLMRPAQMPWGMVGSATYVSGCKAHADTDRITNRHPCCELDLRCITCHTEDRLWSAKHNLQNVLLQEALLNADADTMYTSLSRLPRRSRKDSDPTEPETQPSHSAHDSDFEAQGISAMAGQNPPQNAMLDQMTVTSKLRQYFHPLLNLLPTI